MCKLGRLWSFAGTYFACLLVCGHLLVVNSCMLVVCVHLLVVCGRLLMVYGRFLVVCSRLWSLPFFVILLVVILVVARYIFLMLQLLSSPIPSFLSVHSPKAQVQVFVVIQIDI